MKSARALVLFAPGFEEIETITIIDVLRRAGVDVTAAGTAEGVLEGSHGIRVEVDCAMAGLKASDYDAVILPGGMQNATTLAEHADAQRLLREAKGSQRTIGAICAAPIALEAAGLLRGRTVTSHPSVEAQLNPSSYRTDRVVRDGDLITSRGPGTALEFALEVAAGLVGAERAGALAGPMLAR